jgi:hypothetical protein
VSARAEKAVRLVTASLIAFVFGLLAVIRDSEPFAWVAVAIILVAILAGPVVAPLLRNAPRGRPEP